MLSSLCRFDASSMEIDTLKATLWLKDSERGNNSSSAAVAVLRDLSNNWWKDSSVNSSDNKPSWPAQYYFDSGFRFLASPTNIQATLVCSIIFTEAMFPTLAITDKSNLKIRRFEKHGTRHHNRFICWLANKFTTDWPECGSRQWN